ncbi:hypothetical protein VTH06DRAFT_4995 [Thermothelomyces fergusii]
MVHGRYDPYGSFPFDAAFDHGDPFRPEDWEYGRDHRGRHWDPHNYPSSRHRHSPHDRGHRRRERSRPPETGRTRSTHRPERDPLQNNDPFTRGGRRGSGGGGGGGAARASVPMDYDLYCRIRERLRSRVPPDSIFVRSEEFDRWFAEAINDMGYYVAFDDRASASRRGRGGGGGEARAAAYDSYMPSGSGHGPGARGAPNSSDGRRQRPPAPNQPFRYEYVGTIGPDGEIIDGYERY